MQLAAKESGQGSPVVLLHGLFGSARNLGGLARALSASHRVVAMDLRNHGESGHASQVDYPTLAADVVETMDALGLGQVALVGHSMGGKVAMCLALHAPARVSRLVVADIAPIPYPSHFGGYVQAMLRIGPELSRTAADAVLAPDVPEAAVRGFLLHNFRPGVGWRIGLQEIAGSLSRVESWPYATAAYTGPALFVKGERSDYVPASAHAAIQQLFPAAEFATIADAGHWLHAEQPAAFNAVVASFLDRP